MMGAETEYVVDSMYKSWLEFSDNKDKKRGHPSRKTYGQIIKHAQLWTIVVQELEKAKEKPEGV
jgi:hypothetical protein